MKIVLMLMCCLFSVKTAFCDTSPIASKVKVVATSPTKIADPLQQKDCQNLRDKMINLQDPSRIEVVGEAFQPFSKRKNTQTSIQKLEVYIITFTESIPYSSKKTLQVNGSLIFPLNLLPVHVNARSGYLSTPFCRAIVQEALTEGPHAHSHSQSDSDHQH